MRFLPLWTLHKLWGSCQ